MITQIAVSVLVAGIISLCGFLWRQVVKYKKMLGQQEHDQIECAIEEKTQPIIEEIEELRKYIRKTKNQEEEHIKLIISSYKFRLVQLCKIYIRQGYMTQDQYDQLSEFYKLYTALGGNGQAREYYERAIVLPVHDEEE